MWNAKGMSKAVLAIALVLMLLVQVGVSVAQCRISSKSISASEMLMHIGHKWSFNGCNS